MKFTTVNGEERTLLQAAEAIEKEEELYTGQFFNIRGERQERCAVGVAMGVDSMLYQRDQKCWNFVTSTETLTIKIFHLDIISLNDNSTTNNFTPKQRAKFMASVFRQLAWAEGEI